jgi:hypothetical protein
MTNAQTRDFSLYGEQLIGIDCLCAEMSFTAGTTMLLIDYCLVAVICRYITFSCSHE